MRGEWQRGGLMNSPLTHAEAGDNGDLGGLSLLGVATPETTTDACSSAPQSSSATLLIHQGHLGVRGQFVGYYTRPPG